MTELSEATARRARIEPAPAPPPKCEGEDRQLVVLCRTGRHRLALPAGVVIETMRLLPIEGIAGAPPTVLGLSVIRGAAVAVIDTAALFGEAAAPYQRLVTVRTGERVIALAVDAIVGVDVIETSELEQMPPLLRDDSAIAAMTLRDPDVVFLLNTARLVPDDFAVSGDADRVA